MPWTIGPDSFSKCIVYFADGNARTFFSLDWTHVHSSHKNRDLGLHRLRKLISRYGTRARIAIIYDMASGLEIEKYYEGIKQNNL